MNKQIYVHWRLGLSIPQPDGSVFGTEQPAVVSNSYPEACADTQAHPLGSAHVLGAHWFSFSSQDGGCSDPDPLRTYTEKCLPTGPARAISEAGVSVGL